MDLNNESNSNVGQTYIPSIKPFQRLRGASGKDFPSIERLFLQAGFKLDYKHMERLMVVEDENGIIAVGSLATLVEASFVVEPLRSKKNKVLALTALLQQVDKEVENLKYDNFHVFATNDDIIGILKKKFKFIRTAAKQVLLRWIKE